MDYIRADKNGEGEKGIEIVEDEKKREKGE